MTAPGPTSDGLDPPRARTLGSVRGTLLLWYSAILVLIMSGFGVAVSLMLHTSLLDEVDAELRAHAQALAGGLESHARGMFELELSEDYVRYFQQEGEDAPYYSIFDARGRLIDRSRPGEVPFPEALGLRVRGDAREVVVAAAAGARVVVGKGTGGVTARLRGWIGMIVAVGLVALALALGLGWFLAGRVLAPIEHMGTAAAAITASNLDRRLEVEGTGELARLARVLNTTFDRLSDAFERQTRFTADASHELRTPLSILTSHIELALRKERTPAEYQEALRTSLRAAQRMRAVVEGLLTLARADAGEPTLARQQVDLRVVVDETAAMVRPLADPKEVTVVVNGEPGPMLVEGDLARLREVALNLFTNAINYNRPGGRVEVTLTRRDDQGVRLAVADTGIGIPEKDQAQLFERFFRVDKARSRELGGSGLGLAIMRWIVEAHGGRIAFTSQEGVGTTFTIDLPHRPAEGRAWGPGEGGAPQS